jgi:glycosyltransferase involved in cell wall biosynthesis
METALSEMDRMNRLKVCVIVPTYNNCKTLQRVLDSVLLYTSNIIIVNDGSTDETAKILENYSQLVQIHFSKNVGKGLGLRAGFKKAIALDYNYAITIDSDGQHFASDIPNFVDSLEKEGEALIIGSRNMVQEGVPKKSSFGNKFSNFWFWFETGIRLADTQSGFRLYPLQKIPKKYFTNKFELEIEVIVRSAWRGVPIKNIPIQILYDPKERVSHFRPFQDFTRISILNTVLVVITLVYIKPRDFFRGLKKKGIKHFFLENVVHSDDSNLKKSLSIALGVFIGISPFWGFQTVIVLFLAVLFRLNKAISFIFSNISIPPAIPFIIYGSVLIGSNFIHSDEILILEKSITFTDIKNNMSQYIVGSFILATITAFTFGILAYFLMTISSITKNKKIKNA